MKRTVRFTLVGAALLLAVLACQNTLSSGADPWDPTLGRLTIRIGNTVQASSTIAPKLEMEIAEYFINLEGPDGENESDDFGSTSTSFTFVGLNPGEWSVNVQGSNADGDLIGAGSTNVTVVAGQSVEAAVTVVPLPGPGTLELELDWDGVSLSNPAVVASLAAVNGGPAEQLEFDVDSDSASYSEDHPAGYYDLSIELQEDGAAVWGPRVFALRIIQDETSSRTFAISLADLTAGDIDVVVSQDLQNPYQVSFTGFSPDLGMGQNMTVGVSLEPTAEPDQVRWFINGELRHTGGSVTLGFGQTDIRLTRGAYWLDALVQTGSSSSSHGAGFLVQ